MTMLMMMMMMMMYLLWNRESKREQSVDLR